MKINILTLFVESFDSFINHSIIKRAIDNGIVEINIIDFREYSSSKHKKVDDYPFGGGSGMLLNVQPIDDAISQNNLDDTQLIFMSPQGSKLTQKVSKELSKLQELTIVCGHYEGFDERIFSLYPDAMQISIGDYILTSGELSSQILMDSIIRLLPDTLGNSNSFEDESYSDNLLEYSQYTRPREYKGFSVPNVLFEGNHKKIDAFNYINSLEKTIKMRPDLIKDYSISDSRYKLLKKNRVDLLKKIEEIKNKD